MNEKVVENTTKGLLVFRGLIYIGFGILIFFYPGASIVGVTLYFGLLLILEALALFADGGINKNWSSLFIGILDLVLGLLVLFNLGLSAAVLVWLITIWALTGGIMLFSMGLVSEKGARAPRVIGGILLLLLTLYLIAQPLLFQALAIVYFIGSIEILVGLIMLAAALMKDGSKIMKVQT